MQRILFYQPTLATGEKIPGTNTALNRAYMFFNLCVNILEKMQILFLQNTPILCPFLNKLKAEIGNVPSLTTYKTTMHVNLWVFFTSDSGPIIKTMSKG